MVFTQVFTPGSMCQDPTATCVPVRVFFTTLSLGRNQRGVVTYHSCSLLDICLCTGSCPPQVSTGKLSLLAGSSSVTALLTQPICFIHGPQNTSCYANEACMPLLFFWILLSCWASWVHCLCSRTLSKAASSSHKLLLPLPWFHFVKCLWCWM